MANAEEHKVDGKNRLEQYGRAERSLVGADNAESVQNRIILRVVSTETSTWEHDVASATDPEDLQNE